MKLTLALFLIGLSGPALAQTLVSGGLTFSSYDVTGSNYRAKSTSDIMVSAQISRFFGSKWRAEGTLSGTTSGETLYSAVGVSYHFRSFFPSVDSPSEFVEYKVLSDWSPYAGIDFGFNRVQLTLDRDDGTQTDAVIGAMVGPVVRVGTLYSVNQDWSLQADVSFGYSFSPQVATSSKNLTVFAVYQLP